jgi:hypothetical protein
MGAFAVVASFANSLEFAPAEQAVSTVGVALIALTASTFAFTGGLIVARAQHYRIGDLLLGLGWVGGITLSCMAWIALDLPGARGAVWLSGVSIWIFPLVSLLLMLFPDGHLLSPGWRPAAALSVVIAVAGILLPQRPVIPSDGGWLQFSASWLTANAHLAFLLIPIMLVSAAAALVVRYRRSSGATHAQLKWLAFASCVVVAGYAVQNLTWILSSFAGRWLAAIGLTVLILTFNAVPVACGVAIMRYRLYDIDRVVSRSVAYLGVTAVVVGVYLVVVTAVTSLLPVQADAAVAMATLTAASVLEPTRRRAQHAVDRRFNRSHYDAVNTADAFGGRLSRGINSATVQGDLLSTVSASLQPESVSLWTAR